MLGTRRRSAAAGHSSCPAGTKLPCSCNRKALLCTTCLYWPGHGQTMPRGLGCKQWILAACSDLGAHMQTWSEGVRNDLPSYCGPPDSTFESLNVEQISIPGTGLAWPSRCAVIVSQLRIRHACMLTHRCRVARGQFAQVLAVARCMCADCAQAAPIIVGPRGKFVLSKGTHSVPG